MIRIIITFSTLEEGQDKRVNFYLLSYRVIELILLVSDQTVKRVSPTKQKLSSHF
ncbi:hypothetical protein TTHERM_001031313 (macronuclear) [Tetrahymena thermophila SB210]|uniref:Uncharacterized protein n=1 Tax=Tetrahymena thermophila (strain SB210) TaxID=312017 RepID=W7XEZ6_TETTS|nr:hypothetical protein TTHERM_001031313 [Tetrahymena thermophila SB210]EWS75338.1 hypothetical protein TTHERM_001031313 [Tetrahymena thermophila SB210]|eukprot:XP_012652127.1 hypothetical protein TTHERM_001031313 [Tetrahymena thermophila SB210]